MKHAPHHVSKERQFASAVLGGCGDDQEMIASALTRLEETPRSWWPQMLTDEYPDAVKIARRQWSGPQTGQQGVEEAAMVPTSLVLPPSPAAAVAPAPAAAAAVVPTPPAGSRPAARVLSSRQAALESQAVETKKSISAIDEVLRRYSPGRPTVTAAAAVVAGAKPAADVSAAAETDVTAETALQTPRSRPAPRPFTEPAMEEPAAVVPTPPAGSRPAARVLSAVAGSVLTAQPPQAQFQQHVPAVDPGQLEAENAQLRRSIELMEENEKLRRKLEEMERERKAAGTAEEEQHLVMH